MKILKDGKETTEFPIMSILPEGKENSISSEDLAQLTGCKSVRELQERIASERNRVALICSGSGKGYWRPKNRQEIQEFVKTMDARALNTLRAARSAKMALRIPEGQQYIGRSQMDVRREMDQDSNGYF